MVICMYARSGREIYNFLKTTSALGYFFVHTIMPHSCSNQSSSNKNVSYVLPKYENLKKTWLLKIHRKNLAKEKTYFFVQTILKKIRLTHDMYMKIHPPKKKAVSRKLLKDAIPMLFSH